MRMQFWLSCVAAVLSMATSMPPKKPALAKPSIVKRAPTWILPFRLESSTGKTPQKVAKTKPTSDGVTGH